MGLVFALFGATIAVALPCIGAGIGVAGVQKVSAKVAAEQPEKFASTLVLQLVPTSAGLYGFVVGFMVILSTVMGGAVPTVTGGIILLAACCPVGLCDLFVTMAQGKVCEAGVKMIAKNGELSGRALTMSVISELFNLFGFIVSILAVMMITGDPALIQA
ncbi:MAG: hypothetical protein LBM01_01050 [Christensenellaceae bacterium]|jgi:V/A-type H+-transporting ATPase subunit K|nr:hypothetical protein [Christensenellaceae bacterium]